MPVPAGRRAHAELSPVANALFKTRPAPFAILRREGIPGRDAIDCSGQHSVDLHLIGTAWGSVVVRERELAIAHHLVELGESGGRIAVEQGRIAGRKERITALRTPT